MAQTLEPSSWFGRGGHTTYSTKHATDHQMPRGSGRRYALLTRDLSMPAVSKKQQRFMAMAEHEPEKLRGKKPNMTKKQLHDFAATKTKGLPSRIRPGTRVGERYRRQEMMKRS